MMVKRVCCLTFFWLTLFGPTATAQGQSKKNIDPLKVGVILPLTGSQSLYGEEAMAGVDLAYEYLLKHQPELARRIQLIKKDEGSKPSLAKSVATELIEKHRVSLLFGTVANGLTLEIAKVAEKFRRPLVAPAAFADDLPASAPQIFSTAISERTQGRALAHFAFDHLQKTSAVVIDDGSSYSKAVGAQFVESFRGNGGKVQGRLTISPSVDRFSVVLKKILSINPQLVIMPSSYSQGGAMIKQAKEMGLRSIFLGADRWNNAELGKISGSQEIGGHYFSGHFASVPSKQMASDFSARFKRKLGRLPSSLAAMSFDGLLMVAAAYEKAESNLPEALIMTLAKLDQVEGLLGEMTMAGDRHTIKPVVIMRTGFEQARFERLIDFHGAKP